MKSLYLLLLLSLSLFSYSQVCFKPAQNYTTGAGPFIVSDLKSGDFNGDGHIDLAVANYQENDLTILTGNGQGTFTTMTSYTLNNAPVSMAATDFNSDGKTDLAVLMSGNSSFASHIAVYFGSSSPTFTAAPTILNGTGLTSISLAAGDLDGDGDKDLAAAVYGTKEISIFKGSGNGTFGAITSYSVKEMIYYLYAADLNSDGKADLVGSFPFRDTIAIYPGNSSASLSAASYYSVGDSPYCNQIKDLNGDIYPDIIVGHAYSSFISFLAGNGTGTFASAIAVPTAFAPHTLFCEDFNKDGKLDIVYTGYFNDRIGVLLGTGAGSFVANSSTFAVGSEPYSTISADFNGDGMPDVAAANNESSDASILLNESIKPLPSFEICAGNAATLITSGATSYSWSTGQTSSSIVVTPSITSQYIVSGTHQSGCKSESTVTLSVRYCVGISNFDHDLNSLRVFPNPCISKLMIKLDDHGGDNNQFMQLYDALGSLLYTAKAQEQEIDMSKFPQGIYFLSLSGSGKNDVTKVIKH